MLFKGNIKEYDIPLYRPDFYKIYCSTNDSNHLKEKILIESWFSRMPNSKMKRDIAENIKKNFINTFSELLTFNILLRIGVTMEELTETDKTPDYYGLFERYKVLFEVLTIRGKEMQNESYYNLKGHILNTINQWEVPGLKIGIINLRVKCHRSPNLRNLKRQVVKKANFSVGDKATLVYNSDEFEVELELMRFKEDAGIVGNVIMTMNLGRGYHDERLEAKLRKKINKYSKLELPICLITNVLSRDSKMFKALYNISYSSNRESIGKTHLEYIIEFLAIMRNKSSNLDTMIFFSATQFELETKKALCMNVSNSLSAKAFFDRISGTKLNDNIKMFNLSKYII